MPVIEIFDQVKIWPISIFLPSHRGGYTLWGRNWQNDDILWSIAGPIGLFKTPSTLFRFLKSREGQIATKVFVNSERLRPLVSSKEFYWLNLRQVHYEEFDFVNVQCTLCENYHSISNLRQCAYLLDCLNLLYDVGITLNNQVILSNTKRGGSELADLMDSLTFLRQEELSATLAQFDFRKICLLYGRLLKIFENNLVLF